MAVGTWSLLSPPSLFIYFSAFPPSFHFSFQHSFPAKSRRVHRSRPPLSISLSSLPLSDFQSRFIRFSGLAFFLQHTPLPPKLIGFHYGQGWSAHAAAHTLTHTLRSIPLRTHSNTQHYLSPLSGFYLHLWPSSISICLVFLSFFCCFRSASIHPFPLQKRSGQKQGS